MWPPLASLFKIVASARGITLFTSLIMNTIVQEASKLLNFVKLVNSLSLYSYIFFSESNLQAIPTII